jgi:hypothetical protein
MDHVHGSAGLQTLEACGPSSAPNIWFLTFASKDAKEMFAAAGDFVTKEGLQAKVEGRKVNTKQWIKIHWVPYHVPMAQAIKQLEQIQGVTIIAASYDKVTGHDGMEHVRSLLRTVLVEAPDVGKIPYSIRWSHDGESGTALVTMKNRPPVCLKCNIMGHVRKDCQTAKCAVCSQWGHNNPQCTQKRAFTAVVSGPSLDQQADIVDEDMDDVSTSKQAPGGPPPVVLKDNPSTDSTVAIIKAAGQSTLKSAAVEGTVPPLQVHALEGTPPPQKEVPRGEGTGEHRIDELFGDISSDSDTSEIDVGEEKSPPSAASFFLKNPLTKTPPKRRSTKRKNNRSSSLKGKKVAKSPSP